jgi:hypothetical protein
MFTQSTLRIVAISAVLIVSVAVLGYPNLIKPLSASDRISLEKSSNNDLEATSTNSLSSVPQRFDKIQNSPVWIAINQNGNMRRADPNGYIDVAIRETYKIEISSPNYASAVSVKIDGVSIINGLICDRNVTLERPHAIAKQFIVLEEGNQGLDRDGGKNNPDLGLIEVTFMPIKHRAIALETLPRSQAPSAAAPSKEDNIAKSKPNESSAAVGTGLSGSSSQDFVATNDWIEAPEIAPTYTKKYRLVGISSSEPVTLHNMKTPKPVQIDSAPPRL